MRRKYLSVVLVAVSSDAMALGGVGDVVYDPQLEAQVLQVWQQTKELYNTAKDQLRTAAEINQTIYDAEQAYEAIVNYDIKAAADSALGFKSSQNAELRWKFQGMLNDMNKMESTSTGTGRFYQYQTGRIEAMKNVLDLQETSAANVSEASTDIPERQSGQITAQSTASTAALLAAEDLRRQDELYQRQQGAKADRDAFYNSADIYRAFGEDK